MDKTQLVSGATTYVYRLIEGRQYLVPEADQDNLDFTFQEKLDKATGRPFFVSVLTRSKVFELPDIATLPPMEPLPKEINVGCTVFKTCRSSDGETIYAPEKLPIELANGHCWAPQADRVYGRYTFRNAATGKRCVTLPPTQDYCQRIQRMYAKYSIGDTPSLKAFLGERAGAEEEALADLIRTHGPEPKEYLLVKEQICAVFSRYDASRMGEVIELLEANEGPEAEAALLASLRAQYGEIPKTYRERIAAVFAEHCPERLDCMDAVMATFAEREVGLLAALAKRYGREPGAEPTPAEAEWAPSPEAAEELRRRAIAMLIYHTPSTINIAYEKGMAEHKGNAAAFVAALAARYGIEPSAAERDSMFDSYLSTPAEPSTQYHSPVAARPPVLIKPSAYRDRLTRFYTKYNPSKLPSIDKMLRRYEGSEEQLMAELVKTYGPEPGDEDKETEKEAEVPENKDTEAAKEEPPAPPAVEAAAAVHVDPSAGLLPEAPATEPAAPVAELIAELPAPVTAAPVPVVSPPLPAEPTVASLRHAALTDEELRRRSRSLALVHDPTSLSALEALLPAVGGEPLDALYSELLARFGGRDPTPEEVAAAEEALERLRAEERAREAAAAEEARLAKEEQQRHVGVLLAEMEALKVREAERSREEEGRRRAEEEDLRRRAAALGLLTEAEARRVAAERSVEAVARTSEFVNNDEDGGYLLLTAGSDSSAAAGALITTTSSTNTTSSTIALATAAAAAASPVGTLLVTSSLATADTSTLIGTLAALEEKLQRAYSQVEGSIRKGDALRRANEALHYELNELRNLMAEREKDAQIALYEARNEADRQLSAQEREALDMRAAEQRARAEVLTSFREEQKQMNEDLLRMAAESRGLSEDVSRQRGEIGELERNIRTLQARLAAKEASEVEARAALKLLEESIAQRPATESSFCQTDESEAYGGAQTHVFASPRRYYSQGEVSAAEALQATVRRLEGEVAEWRLRYVESHAEHEAAKAQQDRTAEEYDTALRVVNMLRTKNKKLEAHARALELHAASSGLSSIGAAATTPSRGLEGAMLGASTPRGLPVNSHALSALSLGTPRSAASGSVHHHHLASPSNAASVSSPPTVVGTPDAMSPLAAGELKRRLAASDAESKALRREINDLRGLLAIHMSSPKGRR